MPITIANAMGTSSSPARATYTDAKRIRAAERDRALSLDDAMWPSPGVLPRGWDAGDGFLRRTIASGEKNASADSVLPVDLEEAILRFPSAQLHGLQRLHAHHVRLGDAESFHTYRLLRLAREDAGSRPVTRIFFMHTGLNERDSMGLYYQLASHLIRKQESTVCIVRPFPGHLTRFPFQAFAETPLDRYLWDGSHLFRQFLRYMVETQWFLSALARRSSYRCASGASLLAAGDAVASSRLDGAYLASTMETAWRKLHLASEVALAEMHKTENRTPNVQTIPTQAHFEDAIASLRGFLGLERDYPGGTGSLDDPTGQEPEMHVLGYSLGGFTAQSVFMSWPHLIASCSTLLAGGALRELSPTAFADPEEWQTVLHSLRYELDDRMMSDDLDITEDSVAGVDRGLFTYLKRTFYEVFQQEYRGSFRTRLEAFRQRMLFVVGGNDPVVRPQTVLESGPVGGLNLLEIGGLGHFLDGRPSDREEAEQRSFWLPEVGSLISRLADTAAEAQIRERDFTWFDEKIERPARSSTEFEEEFPSAHASPSTKTSVRRLAAVEQLAIDGSGALPGELFERCLDDLLARVASPDDDGVLFVLRNEIPTLLLHDSIVRERATAMYHDDFGIARHCHGVRTRQEVVREHIDKCCLVLPWNAREIMMHLDSQRAYPSQSESAGVQVPNRMSDEKVWDFFVRSFRRLTSSSVGRDSVRRFDGNAILADPTEAVPDRLLALAKEFAGDEALSRVAALPDCWVWVSSEFLGVREGGELDIGRAIRELARVTGMDYCGKAHVDALSDQIRKERVRIIQVSRARYNPRYRGRLLVTGQGARRLLVHVALCAALSESVVGLGDHCFE